MCVVAAVVKVVVGPRSVVTVTPLRLTNEPQHGSVAAVVSVMPLLGWLDAMNVNLTVALVVVGWGVVTAAAAPEDVAHGGTVVQGRAHPQDVHVAPGLILVATRVVGVVLTVAVVLIWLRKGALQYPLRSLTPTSTLNH